MEKPFICSQTNCKMTFTNEDHLEVHKRCHEIEMNQQNNIINYHTAVTSKLPIFVIDQTPTPTNCLKHCEDVSLFHDITLNPFDEEFRKASQLKTQLSIPDNTTGDSLETPKILPLADSDETISSTSKEVSNCSAPYPNCTSYLNTTSSNPKNISTRVQDPTCDEKEGNRKIRLNINVLPTSDSQTSPKLISTPTPVITAGPSVSQSLSSNGTCPTSEGISDLYNSSAVSAGSSCPVNDTVMAAVPSMKVDYCQYSNAGCSDTVRASSSEKGAGHAQTLGDPVVPPSPAAILQLVLRLPNGQAIPVEIPATPVVSSAAFGKGVVSIAQTNATLASGPSVPSQDCGNNATSVAKMKLKQALTSCSTAAKPGTNKFSRANTADRIAEMTRNRASNETCYPDLSIYMGNSLTGEDDSSEVGAPSGSHLKRRRNYSGGDDPVQKRQKFLERNRVAAVRCREKKKRFVKNLFVKSDELEGINLKLQTEVCTLRSEVALLKSLLLQHKDCPVTLAMQNEHLSGEEYPKSFTTFKIQQPSGVITQVTTTPIKPFSPQSHPEDSLVGVVDTAKAVESAVSQPKILLSSLKLSAPPSDVTKTRSIGVAPVQSCKPQSVTSAQSVGGSIMLPENIRLPSGVVSSPTVILVNQPSTSVSVKSNSTGGSKPTFIITKPAVPPRRIETNEMSRAKCTSLPAAPRRIISLDDLP